MLDSKSFKIIIEKTPLVSIDLCIVCDSQIILGKRENEPLKGVWFTPGGPILKNETWQDCLRRVANSELSLEVSDPNECRLMGVWDHFYRNSALDEGISTHYVNLPHCIYMEKKPNFQIDEQHEEVGWFDLQEVASSGRCHEYMQNYACCLIKAETNND
jgi:colanic acid biosynthesis protein WcaH